MKPSNVMVNSILPILPILLTQPEVCGSLRCLGTPTATGRPMPRLAAAVLRTSMGNADATLAAAGLVAGRRLLR
jgi:hypothetical protein